MIIWYTWGLGPVYNFVILCLVSLNEENDVSSEVSVGLLNNCPISWDPIIHQLNLCYLIMYQSFSITNLYTFQLQTTLWKKKKKCSSWQFYGFVTGALGSALEGGGGGGWLFTGPQDEQKYHLENKFSVLPLSFLPFFFFSFLSVFGVWETIKGIKEKRQEKMWILFEGPQKQIL